MLLIVVALMLVVGLGLAPILRRRTHAVSPKTHATEIDEIFARVDAEDSVRLEQLLRVRTKDLIARRVPVRRIREAPAPHVARIVFSNGVAVLVTTKTHGDLARLARAMEATSVVLEQMRTSPKGPVLRFAWKHAHQLEVYAVGLDQAD